MAEDPYYEGPLFDTHIHIPPFVELPPELAEQLPINPLPVLGKDVAIDDIVCLLDKENIMRAFGFYPTTELGLGLAILIVQQAERNHPQRIVPFLMPAPIFSPTFEPSTLNEVLESNKGLFKGYGELAFYTGPFGGTAPDDPVFLQIYDIVDLYGLIVMVHPIVENRNALEAALALNPNVPFLLHGGDIDEFITDLMKDYQNVYYSLDANLFPILYNAEDKDQFVAKFTENFDSNLTDAVYKWKSSIETFPDRFAWGTDRGATWHFDEEVGGLLEEFSRAFIGRLDPEVQEKFAYLNAEKLLQTR